MSSMRAVVVEKPGGPEGLSIVERPRPEPGPGEILIRVQAAGVNRPDVMQRQGIYPPPPGASDILGLEVAGEVAGLGQGSRAFREGDAVMALVAGGGYAEYVTVPEAIALRRPPSLAVTEAAAVPETFFTVWVNVFERARLLPGETLLVHGGTSGIGTTATQLAKALGSTVFVTAGSAEKCVACLRIGADLAINYRDEDFVAVVKAATNGKGVDVILDMVGGDYVQKNIAAAAPDGRITQIAFQKGAKIELDLLPVMLKRLTFTGSTLRPRTNEVKARLAAALETRVVPLLAQGRCRPVMDTVFPFEKVAEAHRRMDGGEHIGKIVLEIA